MTITIPQPTIDGRACGSAGSLPVVDEKQSGIGVEGSMHGLHAYTDITVVNTTR